MPGTGAVYLPWWILHRTGGSPTPATWPAAAIIAAGAAGYLWCLHAFATAGRGTPGPWDPPRRVVVSGPYRWVRNPVYLAALMVVLGEAWLFHSTALLLYASAMAAFFHLFVIAYESQRCVAGSGCSTTRSTSAASPARRSPACGSRRRVTTSRGAQ